MVLVVCFKTFPMRYWSRMNDLFCQSSSSTALKQDGSTPTGDCALIFAVSCSTVTMGMKHWVADCDPLWFLQSDNSMAQCEVCVKSTIKRRQISNNNWSTSWVIMKNSFHDCGRFSCCVSAKPNYAWCLILAAVSNILNKWTELSTGRSWPHSAAFIRTGSEVQAVD